MEQTCDNTQLAPKRTGFAFLFEGLAIPGWLQHWPAEGGAYLCLLDDQVGDFFLTSVVIFLP